MTWAAAATGYSLIVQAQSGSALAADKIPPLERRQTLDNLAPPEEKRRTLAIEPNMALVALEYDVLVAGGGMSGVCAAVAAARNGAKVLLVQDRSRLGGNASSEVKMHIVGADNSGGRPGWREGGLIEEFRLDDAVDNPYRSFEMWDLLLYDKCLSEPNLTLLLDSVLYAAQAKDGQIEHVMVRCDKTEHLYRVKAKIYCDCTGDSRLALEAGAEYRWGREAKAEFNESLAINSGDRQTLGSSILFTSRKNDRPMSFQPPKWARKVTKDQLQFRSTRAWQYGYWWIEWGGQINTIRDNERIRFELLRIVLGVWDYIKNSGEHPNSANWALEWIGMVPGKRESRRVIGDHILTQHDLEGDWKQFNDAVAIGGWSMDDHPPDGYDSPNLKPCRQISMDEVYNIPLRSLYSKNVVNLMMAGRNISASHVAFTSTRVMATCSAIGQAVGTTAAVCAGQNLLPRQLARDNSRLFELQQRLLRDDQSLRRIGNQDPTDMARKAKVTASGESKTSKSESIINGYVRDMYGEMHNRWIAPMTDKGAWIELSWEEPQTIREVQITFDTGFHRPLTLTAKDSYNQRILRAPQPETVRDYTVSVRTADGEFEHVAEVKGNHQRLRRHDFEPVKALAVRIQIDATNGTEQARIYEVRCYE